MQSHFKEKKKGSRWAIWGRFGNLKVNSESFLFFFFFFLSFLEGGEMPRKYLGAHFSPPASRLCGILGKS